MSIVDHFERSLILVIVLELEWIKLALEDAFGVQVDGALLLAAITESAPLGKGCNEKGAKDEYVFNGN